MRELGLPLAFPGGFLASTYVVGYQEPRNTANHVSMAVAGSVALAKQACDVRVLAKAFEWAGSDRGSAAAANTAFNITNGDTMVWTALYPKIAAMFGMRSSDHAVPMELSKEMPRSLIHTDCTAYACLHTRGCFVAQLELELSLS